MSSNKVKYFIILFLAINTLFAYAIFDDKHPLSDLNNIIRGKNNYSHNMQNIVDDMLKNLNTEGFYSTSKVTENEQNLKRSTKLLTSHLKKGSDMARQEANNIVSFWNACTIIPPLAFIFQK